MKSTDFGVPEDIWKHNLSKCLNILQAVGCRFAAIRNPEEAHHQSVARHQSVVDCQELCIQSSNHFVNQPCPERNLCRPQSMYNRLLGFMETLLQPVSKSEGCSSLTSKKDNTESLKLNDASALNLICLNFRVYINHRLPLLR